MWELKTLSEASNLIRTVRHGQPWTEKDETRCTVRKKERYTVGNCYMEEKKSEQKFGKVIAGFRH